MLMYRVPIIPVIYYFKQLDKNDTIEELIGKLTSVVHCVKKCNAAFVIDWNGIICRDEWMLYKDCSRKSNALQI